MVGHLKAHTLGGEIGVFVKMCEDARVEAYEKMRKAAAAMGANAVIGVQYEASDVMDGVTEFLCFGTAITVVESAKRASTTSTSSSSGEANNE